MKNSDKDAISAIASVMSWWRMRSRNTYVVVGECDRAILILWLENGMLLTHPLR
ncbi:hypothetical protein [Funiculus sociatus]|uniref:hypothetical protein n=1 Tax=Funiculus sociatus TaxID=450527 RepID=UPI003297203A